jgi:YHS domain-containing protein
MVIKFTLFAARSSKSGKKYPHYYFCAEGRRKAFMENPGKFIEAQCAKPKS